MITRKGGNSKSQEEKPKPKNMNYKIIGETFEEELKTLIDSRIEEYEKKRISIDDLNEIAKLLTGDIDKLISNKIKEHLIFISEKVIESYRVK